MSPLRELRLLTATLVLLGGLLFAYTLVLSYSGRADLRDAQVRGCERARLDRAENAAGWRTAEAVREQAFAHERRPADRAAAARYARVASSLERRSRIDCARAFPPASFWP